ncbi:hypothetical protein AMECASPLE_020960 [Ameca splendens]|uniref:Uncharacterized protein n=1 Tax=Ameca splendens TaxID=208324 RepID=A0ABV0Z237_9TELE
MLFIAYSSTFNTILPDILTWASHPPSLTGYKTFLPVAPKSSGLNLTYPPQLHSALALRRAVYSVLYLYSLYTYDWTAAHPPNATIKYADDTTVVGLISGR